MEKVLSIIIPTYNMENYLRKCLDSLIVDKELMIRFEALIINDGSKDSSSEIAHEYENQYPNTFRVIDKENGNYGSCINRGLKEAVGKYVKVLDADDSFNTNEFANLLMFMETVDVDMVVSDYCKVDPNDNIIDTRHYNLGEDKTTWPFNMRISKIFYKKNLQMHAISYRTKNLRKIKYQQTEGISYTDQEWTYTPLVTVNTIAYYRGIVYKYLIGREGQTMDPTVFKRAMSHTEICVLRKLKDFVTIKCDNQAARYFLTKWAYVSLEMMYYNYLVKYKDLPQEPLIFFDKKIAEMDAKLVKMANSLTLKGTGFTYVKHWRENNYCLNTPFLGYLEFYSRVYAKILRMIRK